MFRRVVVPLDLSGRHQPALDHAARIVEQSGGEIVLLHVIELIAGLDRGEERAFYDRLESNAKEHLEGIQAKLADIEARAELRLGERAKEIVSFADETGTDLIVMTSHRVDPEGPPASIATLSYKVAILAGCPVLLVK